MWKKSKDITGYVVLITGGANGIGKQLAIQFAKEKCKIAIVDIDYESACQVVEMLRTEFDIKAEAFRADISKFIEVKVLRSLIEETLGSVDILVNNAGIQELFSYNSMFESSYEQVQKIIDVNFTSNFWVR